MFNQSSKKIRFYLKIFKDAMKIKQDKFKNDMNTIMKINQDILKEVEATLLSSKEIAAIDKQNMERLKDLDTVFQKFDNNLNKISELIERVPEDSVVRPNRTWLNMFGL